MIEISADGTKWSEFVTGQPDVLAFHQPAWMLLLAEY